MRLTTIVVLLVGLSLGSAHAAPLTLQVNDNAMGKTIGKFMQDAHQISFDQKPDKEGPDVTLLRTEKRDKVADFPFVIVTMPYAKDDGGKVTARMVVLMVISGLKVPGDKRGAVLEEMNKLNDNNDYTHLYLDSDNEIAFRWALVVTGSGLPAESVWDAYAGMLPAWAAAGEALGAVLK
ncbi:MAG: YbjN domain-containing protein [Armatimonadota bacterium]